MTRSDIYDPSAESILAHHLSMSAAAPSSDIAVPEAATNVVSESPKGLLQLPAELRLRIYAYYSPLSHDISGRRPPALAQTCRILRYEVVSVWIRTNGICYDLGIGAKSYSNWVGESHLTRRRASNDAARVQADNVTGVHDEMQTRHKFLRWLDTFACALRMNLRSITVNISLNTSMTGVSRPLARVILSIEAFTLCTTLSYACEHFEGPLREMLQTSIKPTICGWPVKAGIGIQLVQVLRVMMRKGSCLQLERSLSCNSCRFSPGIRRLMNRERHEMDSTLQLQATYDLTSEANDLEEIIKVIKG